MKYTINYEFGVARLYTPSEDWRERFLALAIQCWGIRKSIGEVTLLRKDDEEPFGKRLGEFERLEHSGDVIVWNEEGEKIKSEWDEEG